MRGHEGTPCKGNWEGMTTRGKQVTAVPTGVPAENRPACRRECKVETNGRWSQLWWAMRSPGGGLLGMTLGTICQMVLSWRLGASPWLSSPDPWSLGSRWLAEGWGLGDSGGCWGWPAPGRAAREGEGSQEWKTNQPRKGRNVCSPGGCPVTSIGASSSLFKSPPGSDKSPRVELAWGASLARKLCATAL